MATFKLTITFDEATQHLSVEGPINNRMLSFGMLEMAKEQISQFNAKQAQQQVIRPVIESIAANRKG